MSRQKKKQRQRKHRSNERKPRASGAKKRREEERSSIGPIDLRVRRPELAHPPVYVDSTCTRIPDPFMSLGLDPEAPVTSESVHSAFRTALAETPPEEDPERARRLLEARDFLLDPEQILTRTLGDLRVPNAEKFLPAHESPVVTSRRREQPVTADWSSRSRLIAIMTLYALLEEELEGDGPPPRTGSLFD